MSAVTEAVLVEVDKSANSRWFVSEIVICRELELYDDPDEIKYEQFTGSIALEPETKITFTRVAKGALQIGFENLRGEFSAALYNEAEEPAGNMGREAVIYIKNITERIQNGETMVFLSREIYRSGMK